MIMDAIFVILDTFWTGFLVVWDSLFQIYIPISNVWSPSLGQLIISFIYGAIFIMIVFRFFDNGGDK